MMSSNLLSPAARLQLRVHDRLRSWSVILSGYLLVIFIGSIAAWSSSRANVVLAVDVVVAAEADARAVEAKVDEVYGRVRQQRVQLEAELAVGRHPDWSVLLGVIARLKGPSVDLAGVELRPHSETSQASKTARPARYVVQVTGTATNHAELAALVLRFEGLGIFEHVVLAQNRVVLDGELGVEFVVHAELDDSPAVEEPKVPRTEVKR
ncbi:MAG: hypothetical protein NTV94_13650 [Planctomycetota bacterium]|nr:hypothetical protein [Planctomycetota bacterium]